MGDRWAAKDVWVLEGEVEEVGMVFPPYHAMQGGFSDISKCVCHVWPGDRCPNSDCSLVAVLFWIPPGFAVFDASWEVLGELCKTRCQRNIWDCIVTCSDHHSIKSLCPPFVFFPVFKRLPES